MLLHHNFRVFYSDTLSKSSVLTLHSLRFSPISCELNWEFLKNLLFWDQVHSIPFLVIRKFNSCWKLNIVQPILTNIRPISVIEEEFFTKLVILTPGSIDCFDKDS